MTTMRPRSLPTGLALLIAASIAAPTLAQPTSSRPPDDAPPRRPARPPAPKDPLPLLPASQQVKKNDAKPAGKIDVDQKVLDAAVKESIAKLLAMQEGDGKSEWPYEGVYRVGGQIPAGYRFGGTSITALALTRIPGYETDQARKDAVARAIAFVCKAPAHPLIQEETYDAGYDVRGWAYTYVLQFLVEMKARKLIPTSELKDQAEKTILYMINAINKTAIPRSGGWNYAREPGRNNPAGTSTFMTPPTLQALFAAKAAGYTVDDQVIDDALKALDRARNGVTKEMVYSGVGGSNPKDNTGGAAGRMTSAEAVLLLAGRGSVDNVRNAVNTFIKHWGELDKRRQMSGTHLPPYGVAPYYFYFAHFHAAQAIELLPEAERPALREQCNKLLFSVRQEDGTWNDRIFKRSANYSTAFACMAILQPTLPPPAGYTAPVKPKDQQPKAMAGDAAPATG
ncbi:MAG TPA: hypothetical protein VEB22_13370 [Phycisphaerales bacterium]|nr:hypothetical protein [Phycisphaerales bacterium]